MGDHLWVGVETDFHSPTVSDGHGINPSPVPRSPAPHPVPGNGSGPRIGGSAGSLGGGPDCHPLDSRIPPLDPGLVGLRLGRTGTGTGTGTGTECV